MIKKYAYYPGCSLHSTAKEFDMSTRIICEVLGIDLVEIPDWNCCGATSAHALNHDLSVALPMRNLAIAEKMGMDVVAPCAACYNRLKTADKVAKENPEELRRISDEAGLEYNGSINVLSMLEVVDSLPDEVIQKHVRRKLEGLKVACYYGCLLLRPPGTTKFDDPENPKSLDRIVTLLGAESVDWPHKIECCGAGLSLSKSEIVVKLTHDILSSAKISGANCITAACPLCQGNLDMRQTEVESKYAESFGMPIFYFTQLMGLAFGLSAKSLGLDSHMVETDPLLTGAGLKD